MGDVLEQGHGRGLEGVLVSRVSHIHAMCMWASLGTSAIIHYTLAVQRSTNQRCRRQRLARALEP